MLPVLLVLLSALLFGAATPVSKSLLSGLTPVQLAACLYLGAALGVLPAIVRSGGLVSFRRMGRRDLLLLGGSVLSGGVLGPIALLFGLRLAAAGSVSLWLNLELVATAVLGQLMFRDHLGWRGWAGAAGVVLGGAVLSAGEGASGGAAVALVALACTLWGLDNQLTSLIDGITPTQSTFWKGLAAGGLNLALAFLSGARWPAFTLVLGGLSVGMLSYGASIALYIVAAQQLGATRAQMFFASGPFFGAVLSALMLAEPLGPRHLLAAGLMLVFLVLLLRDAHAHPHRHRAVEHEHWHRHDDGHHDHEHPDLPASRWHSHRHRHAAMHHAHRHRHDLHHRHPH